MEREPTRLGERRAGSAGSVHGARRGRARSGAAPRAALTPQAPVAAPAPPGRGSTRPGCPHRSTRCADRRQLHVARRRGAPGRGRATTATTAPGPGPPCPHRMGARRRRTRVHRRPLDEEAGRSGPFSPENESQKSTIDARPRSAISRAAAGKPWASVTSNSASGACAANAWNRSGRSSAVTIAPYPPDDLPWRARSAVRRIRRVDERDDLLRADTSRRRPMPSRVDPLRAADRRPAVDEDDHRVRRERLDLFRIRPLERLHVEPRRCRAHMRHAGRTPTDTTASGPEAPTPRGRPVVRVAERVAAQRRRGERVLLPARSSARHATAARACRAAAASRRRAGSAPAASVSRSRSVIVPSASVCSSIVSAHGVPISSWRR